jgi:hypothetical protein
VDLQQRQTQHGHRRHHTRHETKPVPNGRVVLVPNASTNGGITGPRDETRLATFVARKNFCSLRQLTQRLTRQHLLIRHQFPGRTARYRQLHSRSWPTKPAQVTVAFSSIQKLVVEAESTTTISIKKTPQHKRNWVKKSYFSIVSNRDFKNR